MIEFSPSELACPLFNDLEPTQIAHLRQVMVERGFARGEQVFAEGSQSEDMYLLKSGQVEITRTAEREIQVVGDLGEGAYFGELAFLDGSPRSTAIQASTETVLHILSKQAVLDGPGGKDLLDALYRNIAIHNAERLRGTTADFAHSLEKEIGHLREKNYLNHFLITLLATYSVVLVLTTLLFGLLDDIDVYSPGFGWIYLALLVSPFLYLVWKSGEPWEVFGITTRGWKRCVAEGLGAGLVTVAVLLALASAAASMGWIPTSTIGFTEFLFGALLNPLNIGYFLHSYGQEFVARGVFQTSLQRSLEDRRGIKAVFLTSWVFGLSHIPYGAELVVVSIISSVGFGLFYLRHGNILGVGILHGILGVFAFSMSQLPFADKLN